MTPPSPAAGSPPALTDAERRRASLGIETAALEATLVRLLQDVIDAEARSGGPQVARLVEADAPFVTAVLTSPAQTDHAATVDARDLQPRAGAGAAIDPDCGADRDTLTPHADASTRGHARAGEAPAPADPARWLAGLRAANERLVLAALSAQELRAAAERARQRQSAFMAAVADELGNPLAPIRIATSMLGRLPGEAPLLPRVQQAIEQQMAQMSGLMRRLVEASADADGSLVRWHERVDMVAVVQAAVANCSPLLQRHRLRLDWQPPATPILTVGDAARLEQIVASLLDHACTHTPDGGRIAVTLAADAQTLTLTVADNGLGIPAQALPAVFEPFVLDLHALDFRGVGLGVGLTVARALVQAHGGSISAHSAGVRRGAEFMVTLPRAPAPHGPAATPAGPPTAAGTDA